MRSRLLVLAFLVPAAAAHAQAPGSDQPPPAAADPAASDPAKVSASVAFAAGQKAFVAKDYRTAAAQFEIAYNADPNPLYLFNAAQAYRLAGDCAKALAAYLQFQKVVQDQKLNVSGMDEVQGYISGLKLCNNPAPAPAPPPAPHRPLYVPAYALMGVGAATLLFAAAAEVNDLVVHGNADTAPSGLTRVRLNADGHWWATAGDLTGYIGGGLVVAGAALWYFHNRGDHEQMISATPLPGGAAVSGTWHF